MKIISPNCDYRRQHHHIINILWAKYYGQCSNSFVWTEQQNAQEPHHTGRPVCVLPLLTVVDNVPRTIFTPEWAALIYIYIIAAVASTSLSTSSCWFGC